MMDREISSARLRAIIETQNEIASSQLSLDDVMRIVAEKARELTSADTAVVERPGEEDAVHRIAAGRSSEYLDARSMISVPLRPDEEVAGVLRVFSAKPNVYTDEDVETLNLLSAVIAAHMANALRYAPAAHESRTDPLTTLGNRRAYDTALAAELSYCRRHHVITSLCLIDLDGFKNLNERLGHAAGDEVLRGVGGILAEGRIEDRTFRIGGDEFAVIYRDTDCAGAEIAAARLADQIDAELAGLGVTASYGVAETDGDPAFTAEADQRLYAMKTIRAAIA